MYFYQIDPEILAVLYLRHPPAAASRTLMLKQLQLPLQKTPIAFDILNAAEAFHQHMEGTRPDDKELDTLLGESESTIAK